MYLQEIEECTLEQEFATLMLLLDDYGKRYQMCLYQEAVGDERMEYRQTDSNGNKESMGKSILMFLIRAINNLVYHIRSFFKKNKESKAQKAAAQDIPPNADSNTIKQFIQNKNLKVPNDSFKVAYNENNMAINCQMNENVHVSLYVDINSKFNIITNINLEKVNNYIKLIGQSANNIKTALSNTNSSYNFNDANVKNSLISSIEKDMNHEVLPFAKQLRVVDDMLDKTLDILDDIENIIKQMDAKNDEASKNKAVKFKDAISSLLKETSQISKFFMNCHALVGMAYSFGYKSHDISNPNMKSNSADQSTKQEQPSVQNQQLVEDPLPNCMWLDVKNLPKDRSYMYINITSDNVVTLKHTSGNYHTDKYQAPLVVINDDILYPNTGCYTDLRFYKEPYKNLKILENVFETTGLDNENETYGIDTSSFKPAQCGINIVSNVNNIIIKQKGFIKFVPKTERK
jgi:hypothetical protein